MNFLGKIVCKQDSPNSKLMNLLKIKINLGSPGQWWILGEANEAVASGPHFLGTPSKILQIVLFCCICFFRDHHDIGKVREIRDQSFF